MAAYAELQAQEFSREKDGYKATTHQKFVGTGYFDLLSQVSGNCCPSGALGHACVQQDYAPLSLHLQVISQGTSSVCALAGSTEEEQFHH